MTTRIARTLGKYEIIDELGKGGFATVYRARLLEFEFRGYVSALQSSLSRRDR